MIKIKSLLISISLLLLISCSESSTDNPSNADNNSVDNTPVLAKIVITETSQLLIETGEQRQFHAEGLDQFNQPIDTDIVWQGTHSDQLSLDESSGTVIAVNVGSTTLTAHAKGLTSAPVTVVFAKMQPAAIAVTDQQIMLAPAAMPGDPVEYGVGTQFAVSLQQLTTPPLVGEILFGDETMPFAGRVVEVVAGSNAGEYQLVMEVIAIDELYAEIEINENIPLKNLPVQYTDNIASSFDVSEDADGNMVFTPKEAPAGKSEKGAVGTSAINAFAPYDCKFTPDGLFDPENPPLRLGLGNQTVTVDADISLPIIYSKERGLEKIALKGEVKASFSAKFDVVVAFEAKLTCRLELGQYNIPLPGPLGFLVGAQVPFGVGMEIGGKLKLADFGVELKAKAAGTVEFGYYNPIGCDTGEEGVSCGFDGTLVSSSSTELNLDLPNTDNGTNDITLEPTSSVFAYALLSVGNHYVSVLSLEMLEVRNGASLSTSLSSVEGQIEKTSYKSDYKLSLDVLAKPGADVTKALKFFKVVSFANVQIKSSLILSTSPAAQPQGLTVDVHDFEEDDELTFVVQLDASTVSFIPGVYNVKTINIYEKVQDGTALEAVLIATEDEPDGASVFELYWTATHAGTSSGNFYAFVETWQLLLPFFNELELGSFTAPPPEQEPDPEDPDPGPVVIPPPGGGPSCITDPVCGCECAPSGGV